jgi:TPR repeat protein
MKQEPPVSTDAGLPIPAPLAARRRGAHTVATARRCLSAVLLFVLLGIGTTQAAHADALARGTAAYYRGDYIRAARELSPLAQRGNARALALLGFLYEHGFGAPQAYDAAADLYCQAAIQGNPFAQAMLGLMYDKGHGVPQDFVLAYKWLNLAAAHSYGHERDAYARFRDAVASKMSTNEIVEGQWLALNWTPAVFTPYVRASRGVRDSRYHPE